MTAPADIPRSTRPPPAARRDPGTRMGAGALAVALVVALVLWVPLVDELRVSCAEIAASSCRRPAALLRWGQYVVGIPTAILGVATVVGLALYAVRERWLRPATAAALGFVGGAALWVILYLVSLPSLL